MIDLGVLPEIKHVHQQDAGGCGIACLAMVLGITYQDARKIYLENGGDPEKLLRPDGGISDHTMRVLIRRCLAPNTDTGGVYRVEVLPGWNPLIRGVCRGVRRNHWVVIDGYGNLLDPASTRRTGDE